MKTSEKRANEHESKQEEINSPENQLAHLRAILFGTTAKTLEEQLATIKSQIIEYQSERVKVDKANIEVHTHLQAYIDGHTASLQQQIDGLQEEIKQLKHNFSQQIEQLHQEMSQQNDLFANNQQEVSQKLSRQRETLGQMLVQLGSQMQQEGR